MRFQPSGLYSKMYFTSYRVRLFRLVASIARQSQVLASPFCQALEFTVRRNCCDRLSGLRISCRVNSRIVLGDNAGTCRNSCNTAPLGSVYLTMNIDLSAGSLLISVARLLPVIEIRTTFGTEAASGVE